MKLIQSVRLITTTTHPIHMSQMKTMPSKTVPEQTNQLIEERPAVIADRKCNNGWSASWITLPPLASLNNIKYDPVKRKPDTDFVLVDWIKLNEWNIERVLVSTLLRPIWGKANGCWGWVYFNTSVTYSLTVFDVTSTIY